MKIVKIKGKQYNLDDIIFIEQKENCFIKFFKSFCCFKR